MLRVPVLLELLQGGSMRKCRGYVYILTNRRLTVLYTGVTSDIQRRLWEHRNHAVSGFTATYKCELLVHLEVFDRIEDALAREKQVKHWSRARKRALVEQGNPTWRDLAP